MQLASSAFADGAAIPHRFTCDGENLSPPLNWSGAPAQTRSFVVLCDDPDAPAETWHHWAAYDVTSAIAALDADAAKHAAKYGFKQAINDFQQPSYGGPCPPRHHGPHHYHFRLLALSVDRIAVPRNASCGDVEREARKHVLAEAILVGVYQRRG